MRFWRAAQLALVLAFFAYLVVRTDLAAMRDAIANANASLIVVAALLTVPVALLFGVRSSFVLTRLGYRLSIQTALPIAIVGNVAGSLTPASSGEVLRGVLLRSRANVAARDGAALVLFERGLSVYVIALTTAAAALLLAVPLAWLPAILAAAAPLLVLPGMVLSIAARVLVRADETKPTSKIAFVRDGMERLVRLARDPALVVPWSAVTVGIFSITSLQYWLIARSLADDVAFHEAWIAFGASQLVGIVTLLPLGLGSSDAAVASLLRRFGLAFSEATSGAILVRAANTLPLIIVAFASYMYLQTQQVPEQRMTDDSRSSPDGSTVLRRH
ncbi:MAG: lysylphosphatidylglycerol synthase transmembrane domain-containing protein [Dehalococcoidia bacterium]